MINNLEAKNYVSAIQIAVLVLVASLGGEIFSLFHTLAKQAEQGMWMSILLAGASSYLAAWCMIKLGQGFPGLSIVQYLPILWGKWVSRLILGWFVTLLIIYSAIDLAEFSHIIAFFMFDRTPIEVISIGMMIIYVYCALQDWGTLIRILEFMFFVTMPIVLAIWLISIFNFQPEFLLPLLPRNTRGIFEGAISSWDIYAGYEFILLLIPMLKRGEVKVAKAVGCAFLLLSLFSAVSAILVIGGLSVDGVKNSEYPALALIRSIEVPGTFIERLENYMLLVWIPIVFDTLAVKMVLSSRLLTECFNYKDHRPIVMFLAPIIFMLSLLCVDVGLDLTLHKLVNWMGIIFSFGIIPITLMLFWYKQRAPISVGKGN